MSQPPDTATPQARCEHAIRHAFSAAIVDYYRRHPAFLKDEVQLDATSYAMLKLMDTILETLQGYVIADRPKP
jgi:hypothetical protein